MTKGEDKGEGEVNTIEVVIIVDDEERKVVDEGDNGVGIGISEDGEDGNDEKVDAGWEVGKVVIDASEVELENDSEDVKSGSVEEEMNVSEDVEPGSVREEEINVLVGNEEVVSDDEEDDDFAVEDGF